MSDDQSSTAQSPCPSIAPTVPETGPTHHAPALMFDPKEYRHFLTDCDWTEAQKDEFTEALWQIVLNFVDLGFGLHPLQQVKDVTATLAADSPNVVTSKNNSNISETTDAASTKLAVKEAIHDNRLGTNSTTCESSGICTGLNSTSASKR